jgi:hypothetical protein
MPDDLGLSPQAAVLAFGFGNPTPATPAPAPPAAPTTPTAPATPVEPYSPARLSPSNTAQWIEWEKDNLAQGKITPEEAARRFDALGATPEQRAPDTRSAEVKLLDQHFPAAKPEEFLIRYGESGQVAPPMTPELKQFDTSARSWLNKAEFPATIGNGLISTIAKVAQKTKHLSADALESYGLLQYERLERVYGAELEDKLNATGRMVEQLEKKTPGLKNLLRSNGIGDNAEVASLLIQQSERYWIRRKGR